MEVRGVDLSMKTVRRITAEMRPAAFENLGLAAALDWNCHSPAQVPLHRARRRHRRGGRNSRVATCCNQQHAECKWVGDKRCRIPGNSC